MKNKRLLIFAAAGVLGLTAAWRVGVHAQTLAGTTAAVGAGASLGAAGGAGLLTPGNYAAPATNANERNQKQLDGEIEGGGAGTGGAGTGGAGAGGEAEKIRPAAPALKWGPETGDDMVRQLTSVRRPRASNQATRRSSRNARSVSNMTRAQRSRMIAAKYQKPAVGYLAWYLKEDRYKVTSKVWQFVTTPNDRFYYRPWAPAMKLRNPGRVIGFHTWQDAMIAGYRPDPATRPEPGPQLAYLASVTRGPMLSNYFEYVYSGQITPATFEANYQYVRYVVNLLSERSDTRRLTATTIDKVLGAALGLNPLPTSVGGVRRAPKAQATGGAGQSAFQRGVEAGARAEMSESGNR